MLFVCIVEILSCDQAVGKSGFNALFVKTGLTMNVAKSPIKNYINVSSVSVPKIFILT